MSNPTDPENSAFEPMVARLEIEQLGDAASEKQITDAVKALNGVTDVKVEKDALFVTYDPLITTEKKIEAAVRSSGSTVKAAGTDTEGPRPPPLTLGRLRGKGEARRDSKDRFSRAAETNRLAACAPQSLRPARPPLQRLRLRINLGSGFVELRCVLSRPL